MANILLRLNLVQDRETVILEVEFFFNPSLCNLKLIFILCICWKRTERECPLNLFLIIR